MSVWSIVVAGGSGARFGGAKQFASLQGRRVVDLAVDGAAAATDGVVVVLPAGVPWDGAPVDAVAVGAATRSGSVRAGLAALPVDAEIVIVHDAARPLASPGLFAAVIAAVRAGADAAVPGVPVVDTLKRVDGDRVVETVPRAGLVAVQTPQAFRAAALFAAHEGGDDATDDAGLVEAQGGTVVVVPGEIHNRKITRPEDLELLASLDSFGESDA